MTEKMIMSTKMVIMMTIRLIKMNQHMTNIMVRMPKTRWYSDDDIDTIFEGDGDPDAYWNID